CCAGARQCQVLLICEPTGTTRSIGSATKNSQRGEFRSTSTTRVHSMNGRSRTDERKRFQARVDNLLNSPPHLPNFSAFADMFRDEPRGTSREGHMREAFYLANNPANCEHIDLLGDELDRRLDEGPTLVGANFVIPYPPGFPLIVPGQIVTGTLSPSCARWT
ncbi:MAG: hypothetical protein ACOYD1_11760, partial [Candidatus Nanopelagicales bacterium]